MADSDPALDALHALSKALEANGDRLTYALRRAEEIERLRGQGYTWRQILATEERPLITDLLNQNAALLYELAGRFRRAEARSLFEEGANRQEIADTFGVTLDHVEAMLAVD